MSLQPLVERHDPLVATEEHFLHIVELIHQGKHEGAAHSLVSGGPVVDDIIDERPLELDPVGDAAGKADEALAIPGADAQACVSKHTSHTLGVASASPGGLPVERQQLLGVEIGI